MAEHKPYGTWPSPISIDGAISTYTVFDDVLVDPKTQIVYHLEEYPKDGRCLIFRTDDSSHQSLLPSDYSVRTSVQEYGGAPAIVYDGVIYFSNQSDNRIYSLDLKASPSQPPQPITPDDKLKRYANFVIHPKYENLLVTLQEDHTDEQPGHPETVVNNICVVDTNAKPVTVSVVIKGAGFYACPVFNDSGTKIAWQQWDLPDMPWQGGIVCVADVRVDVVTSVLTVLNQVEVAGKQGSVSATFPRWITGSDTELLLIVDHAIDASGTFQTPYIYHADQTTLEPVLGTPVACDFSEPAWYLGQDPYAILDGAKNGVFTAFKDGRNILYVIDFTKNPRSAVEIAPFDFVVAQHIRPVDQTRFVFTGTKSSDPDVYQTDLDVGGVVQGTVSVSGDSYSMEFTVLRSSGQVSKDPVDMTKYLSKPIPKNLRDSGDPKNALYVVYYEPKNPDYVGLVNEVPPCIIGVHGGPTGLEPQSLNMIKMFYTSRGYAWLDVNYRGSSSYGRDYIDTLYGNWGWYDIEDCQYAAKSLSDQGFIDLNRVAIRGGSAGGYTTLGSITFAENPKFYKTSCSAFGGVTDPTLLTNVTEKFECRYLDTLFGCPPGPGGKNWDSRSPIKNIVDAQGLPKLSVPLLMLHGEVDGVVPPQQARAFLQNITQLLPSELIEFQFFPGEGHHWHQFSTMAQALERESGWYGKSLV